LRQYVAEVGTRVVELQQQLQASEQRNQLQSKLIDSLEARLRQQQGRDPQYQQKLRDSFFRDLRAHLPLSPIYEVKKDRLVVRVDPVFVFSTSEIGAEGEARLSALIPALQQAMQPLPKGVNWKLHVQGHSDIRQIRGNARFASNWELSAARAVAFLQMLRRGGIDEQHLYASGLAATRLAATGDSKADHRKNRRIEIHLEFSSNS